MRETSRAARRAAEQIDERKGVGAIDRAAHCVEQLRTLRQEFFQRQDIPRLHRQRQEIANPVTEKIGLLGRNSIQQPVWRRRVGGASRNILSAAIHHLEEQRTQQLSPKLGTAHLGIHDKIELELQAEAGLTYFDPEPR